MTQVYVILKAIRILLVDESLVLVVMGDNSCLRGRGFESQRPGMALLKKNLTDFQ